MIIGFQDELSKVDTEILLLQSWRWLSRHWRRPVLLWTRFKRVPFLDTHYKPIK